jgi:hypothetical protein
MKISKTHKEFANRYYFDVLNHPGDYLGPNWEAVIDFWLYLDTLSVNQLRVVHNRYWGLSSNEWVAASLKIWTVAESTINCAHVARNAVYRNVCYAQHAAEYTTLELIGLDKLLAEGHQPIFFPMFLNP